MLSQSITAHDFGTLRTTHCCKILFSINRICRNHQSARNSTKATSQLSSTSLERSFFSTKHNKWMRRIYRHWVALRAPQYPSSGCLERHYSLLIPNSDVPTQRLLFVPRRRLTLHCSVRYFSQISYVAAGQATQLHHKAESDDCDGVRNNLQDSEEDTKREIDRSLPGQNHSPSWQPFSGPGDAQPRQTDHGDHGSHGDESRPTQPYHDDLPLDEDEFAALDGFWSFRASDLYPSSPPKATQSSSQEGESDKKEALQEKTAEVLEFTDQEWRDSWWSSIRPNKIDLSNWKPSVGERESTYPAQRKITKDWRATGFRANGGQRRMVAHFLDRFYYHVSQTEGLSDTAALALLTDPVFASLKNDTNRIVEILNWSWLVAAHPEKRFKRLTALLRPAQDRPPPQLPQWLALQMLRSERIGAPDFVNLLDIIMERSEEWSTKASLMALIVRLLRHARSTTPSKLCTVVEYFVRLLGQHYTSASTVPDLQDRAHWCNRVLRLLAIPTRSNPFMHIRLQQEAQLLLLHHMYNASPAIPLNREGYRALVMLQLMHEKTDVERAWARRQADTWPPWEEQHQMGLVARPRESSGSTSRTNTVLLRMREDGYSPYPFDMAAQILGGRDSDGSPTTQVRRTPSTLTISSPWLPDAVGEWVRAPPQIWAARITATRTIREAWMGFCAYEATCHNTKQSNQVYLAMFQKLWADTISPRPERGLVPGDGLENFPDPELVRDHVHVPEEPPSAEQLYARMRQNGLQPSGRLLSLLLQRERNLSRGLSYIAESSVPPNTREVLADPVTHSPMQVAKLLSASHTEFVRGYIGLLARPHMSRLEQRPASLANGVNNTFSGLQYALRVLGLLKTSDPFVLTEYILGVSDHLKSRFSDYRTAHLSVVWRCICDSYYLESTAVDCSALPHLLFAARSVQTWTGLSGLYSEGARRLVMDDPLELAKRFFITAVSGTKVTGDKIAKKEWNVCMTAPCTMLRSVPTADVVQDLALLVLSAQSSSTTEDIMKLLRWMYWHREQTMTVSTITKRNLAAFRTYLEGQWATRGDNFPDQDVEIAAADPSQIDEAKHICEQLGGWPDDEEVDEYLRSSREIFARVRKKLKRVLAVHNKS